MEEQQEQAFKKQKRDEWSDEMLNDVDILKRDDAGMYVLCRICKQKASGEPFFIKSQNAFGVKSWKKHKISRAHCMEAGKSYASITSFFPVMESAPRNSENTNQSAPAIRKCSGIYDTKDERDKYLSLMVTYGRYDDLNISIRKEGGSIGAFVSTCLGQAKKQNTQAYYNTLAASAMLQSRKAQAMQTSLLKEPITWLQFNRSKNASQ